MAKKDYSNWSKEELIKEIKKVENIKKYGIVWEDKLENVAELCKDKLPILVEDKSKEIETDKNKTVNILIEGDNYHALSVLNYTHKGKIDVIYIDPPYNTGSKDFRYNDKIVDTEDSFRHSKWLSFMEKRLKLAKPILKDSGVILISIDDNEQAQLKLLCDEIFGENNFVNTLAVLRRVKSLNSQFNEIKTLNQAFEYILVYRKTDKFIYINPTKGSNENRKLGYWNSFWNSADRPTMRYEIDGINITKGQWKWKKERAFLALNNYKKFMKTIEDESKLKEYWLINKDEFLKKHHVEMEFIKPTKTTVKYWVTPSETTIMDTNLMEYYVNDDTGRRKYNFDTAKHPELIKKIIDMTSNKNAFILDFFAGSGTTGQAVLELNKEDEGNRKFIICTNNENNICLNSCYPRIKSATTEFGGNIKYFKTDFVDANPTDKNKKRLVDKSTEMLCLKEDCFEEIKKGHEFKIFKNAQNKYLGIIYDDDGIEEFKEEAKKLKKKFVVFVFSLDESAREEEFEDIADLVELKPIPSIILNVYKRIFK